MTAGLFDLTGTLAVVTGARRGIGRAMAEALADAGADIIGVSASLVPGSDVQASVEANGRSVRRHPVRLRRRGRRRRSSAGDWPSARPTSS